eukprot:TRINITY_DN4481_c0_g1_i2.p1 TRINITY_DN4481_c0_g1~~TRINITY_DN4481_c0_g1_i2.p1  ORF type:complete len:373 (-),score=63.96 TRINITY_DN4481_c0_g1_i2:143-1189(-)
MNREDQQHFQDIVDAFAYYGPYSKRKIAYTYQQYNTLEESHKKLLPRFAEKMKRWELCVAANQIFINKVIEEDLLFAQSHGQGLTGKRASDFNMEKVVSTLRQLCREWGEEGREERSTSYDLLVAELCRVLPVDPNNPYQYRVLSPGSGLGRLPFDICSKGYCSQGNEWSYFMLIAGNFILNKSQNKLQHTIYPFVHQTSNVVNLEDQFRAVMIPDVQTTALPPNADFSYAAGDFVEIYSDKPDYWDALVTCFFLDTANNIIEFIETIYKILKPGGKWINLGPLLYHYTDMPGEQSIDISYEEVLHVITKTGFIIEKNERVQTFYTHNPKGMMNTLYNAGFLSLSKPQ